MNGKVVTVFGGSGFIGRHLVRRLAAKGWRVRVAVRHPPQANFLQPMGDVGQIVVVPCSVTNEAWVAAAVRNSWAVVNLVGILAQSGASRFPAIHVEGAERVARLAKAAGADRLVHISALGADSTSASQYARTKAEGEREVREAFPEATVFRPSVVFGPEDSFFNRFARVSQLSPVLPVFTGRGFGTRGPSFQPVYVGDVADAIMTALQNPACLGRTYELGGPRRYTMRQIMETVLQHTGRQRLILPLPFEVGGLVGLVLQNLPSPMLTLDQMRQLWTDNVVSGDLPGLEALGIAPTPVEAILPSYLRPSGPGSTHVGIPAPER
jgi:NADH dehydrogenase